jgi:hypothetical protein
MKMGFLLKNVEFPRGYFTAFDNQLLYVHRQAWASQQTTPVPPDFNLFTDVLMATFWT